MNGGDDDRARLAESLLAKIGVPARVEAAGAEAEIAVIRPIESSEARFWGRQRIPIVHECLAAGFQYVALELY